MCVCAHVCVCDPGPSALGLAPHVKGSCIYMSMCIVLLHYIPCVCVSVSRLWGNNLGDCGVKRLCEALRNPECKIQRLELDSNRLSDGCTDDLVSALSTNRSLRILDLRSNSFTDGSVPALCRLIETCTSLEEIRLWGNRFSSDGRNQLRSLRGIRAELSVSFSFFG
uniref:Uncharacterized protein n=2 Tax=Callorhinchus milii TaxID=7868 RepID=A0A4W3INA7_CALMI